MESNKTDPVEKSSLLVGGEAQLPEVGRVVSGSAREPKRRTHGRFEPWIRDRFRQRWFRRTVITLIAAGLFVMPLSLNMLLVTWLGRPFAAGGILALIWLIGAAWVARILTRQRLMPPSEIVVYMLLGAEIGAGIVGVVFQSLLVFTFMQPLVVVGIGFIYFDTRKYTVRNTRFTRIGVGRWCDECDYDMQGLEDGLVCPECGANRRYELDPDMTIEMEQSQAAR